MSHTPGPWRVVFEYAKQLNQVELTATIYEDEELPFRVHVCTLQSCVHINGIGHDELKANARLIAAAPDMYHALKELLAARHEWHPDRWEAAQDNAIARAKAAIAKAEGK